MILLFDGAYILQLVAVFFATAFRYLDTPLFTFNGHNVSLWTVCLSLLGMKIFVDFLNITGVWGYSEDDFDMEGYD